MDYNPIFQKDVRKKKSNHAERGLPQLGVIAFGW